MGRWPATTTAHGGTAPAAAMPTPFAFPCGVEGFQHHERGREACAPPGFDEYWESSVGYYSPALCPQGYTAGCYRWHEDQGPTLEPTETAVQCVPSGYVCASKDISAAYSFSHSAPMIQVRWAETDLLSLATQPLLPEANPIKTGFHEENPQPTGQITLVARQNAPSNGGGNSMSSATKAGIGVGVSLGAIILIIFVWGLVRRRRIKKLGGSEAAMPQAGNTTQSGQRPGATGGVMEELPHVHAGPSLVTPQGAGTHAPIERPFLAELGDTGPSEIPIQPNSTSSAAGFKQPGWSAEKPSGVLDLTPPSHFVEMDSNQQPFVGLEIDRKASGSDILLIQKPPPLSRENSAPASPMVSGPETQVSIHPGPVPHVSIPPEQTSRRASMPASAVSEEDLRAQHAQLEETRRRIELEQAALQQRMKALNEYGSSTI